MHKIIPSSILLRIDAPETIIETYMRRKDALAFSILLRIDAPETVTNTGIISRTAPSFQYPLTDRWACNAGGECVPDCQK